MRKFLESIDYGLSKSKDEEFVEKLLDKAREGKGLNHKEANSAFKCRR